MANYADPRGVRKACGLDEADAPDADLQYYIEMADTLVMENVAIRRIGETLSGNINGINSTFECGHRYIADTDFDCSVSTSEVTVYAWGNRDYLNTRIEWGVGSLDSNEGKIYLSSVPPASYDVITMDYYFYKNKPSWFLLKRAANFYAAYDYIFSEYLLLPRSVRHGALSWTQVKPYIDLKQRFEDAISQFNYKIVVKREHPSIEMGEKYLNEY